MQTVDKLISARWIVPIEPLNQVLENHSIAIDQDQIAGILPTENAEQHYQAKEHIELPDHALMPGLVNAHTHSPMTLFRGLADDLDLMDWLNKHIWPAEAEIIDEASVTTGTRLAIAEMIRGGTTCFNEHYMFPNIIAEVAKEAGMRCCVGLITMDVSNKWAKDGVEGLQKGLDIYSNAKSHPLITWSIAPQGPYTTTDETFLKIKTAAKETGLPIHIHLHETRAELNIDLQQYGKRPIKRLHDLGLLSDKLIAVHMVHLTDDEIQIIKEHGCQVVHCPDSNFKLASGIAPITKMMDAGINVAIGTDSAASNNDLDMFGELRLSTFAAKVESQNPTTQPAAIALQMATLNGAKALGLDHKIGSLKPGKAADIIAIDLASYLTQPIYNPISHLAYAANRLQVSDVWIAGQRLLEKGKLTQLDINTTLAQTHSWADKIRRYAAA